MKVNIETDDGKTSIAELDERELQRLSLDPLFSQLIGDAFKIKNRVPDVWRYVFRVENGNVGCPQPVPPTVEHSRFPDRPAVDAEGMKTVLLLLESPHVDEFELLDTPPRLSPRAPAQGPTGRAINKCLYSVLKQLCLPDGEYAVIVANPIQYHCSLKLLSQATKENTHIPKRIVPRVRDHVWNAVWALPSIQRDFLRRCQFYGPSAVVNCCTSSLREKVTIFLKQNGLGGKLFEADHPSCRWNIQYSRTGTIKLQPKS